MTKRARWDGPGKTNVYLEGDINLQDPAVPKDQPLEPGQLLPLETVNGTPIPAAVRDELLSRENWSEVNQADQSSKKDDEPKATDKKTNDEKKGDA